MQGGSKKRLTAPIEAKSKAAGETVKGHCAYEYTKVGGDRGGKSPGRGIAHMDGTKREQAYGREGKAR